MIPSVKQSSHVKVMLLAFASGVPGLGAILYLMDQKDYSLLTISTILVFLVSIYAYCFTSLYRLVVNPWKVMANIIAALKERDYTLRVRYPNIEDPMGLSFDELNSLADYLQSQRMDMMESHELLYKILQEVEAGILCFDQDEQLVMANEYARNLYNCHDKEGLKGSVEDLGLKGYLGSNLHSAFEIEFPARKSRWLVKQSVYRENGLPHTMLLIADLQGPLREEELDAWKKLIRVLGHELNNSMTPIKSMADSLTRIMKRDPLPEDWKEDMGEGLSVIGRRVEGLSRFVTGYSELARIPVPQKRPFELRGFIERAIRFNTGNEVRVIDSPGCDVFGDEAQLEQVMTNLLKNAMEATDELNGIVEVRWEIDGAEAVVRIVDEGHGLANADNVFVPFFSTKPTGSGIGLSLSRQIVEAHGGRISLENRKDRSGCVATLSLPLAEG